MMQQKLSKAIVFLMFPLVAGACGIKQKSELDIVGGRKVTNADTGPEKVSTVGLNGCTGTIIARDLILTAAHCYDNSVQGGYVLFGIEFSGRDRKIINIASASVNPSYTGSSNDVAMLKLAQDIPAGYQPIKLLPPAMAMQPGEGVRQAGYGSDNTANSFGTLRTVDSQYVGQTGQGALSVRNGRTAACSGDSGGPLYVQKNGEWFTAGITSTAFMDSARRCTGGNQYTSVALQYNLIVDMARKLTGRQNPLEGVVSPKPEPEDLNGTPNNPAKFQVLTDVIQNGDLLSVRVKNITGRVVKNCEFTLTAVRYFYDIYAVTYDMLTTLPSTAVDQEGELRFQDPYASNPYLSAIASTELKKTCAE
ncbi:MAG TPA: trypsin-like serine protease [Oligoflexus sp.]|uniref:S1 family peptidase n=1 Tax=Oligoflexus sp. TaxID=1971216 RepID=UPI002D303E30|nr:trypsin-like serine protease [Oligoflexus sp.]HYX34400.1 trypsin-like serine protease [Oligoflexus sp.]